jgi:hypothetical protein
MLQIYSILSAIHNAMKPKNWSQMIKRSMHTHSDKEPSLLVVPFRMSSQALKHQSVVLGRQSERLRHAIEHFLHPIVWISPDPCFDQLTQGGLLATKLKDVRANLCDEELDVEVAEQILALGMEMVMHARDLNVAVEELSWQTMSNRSGECWDGHNKLLTSL